MSKLVFSIGALMIVMFCNAQDLIYLSDKELVEAKVEQIKDYFILYKKYYNQTGPVYEISKLKIDSIVYENGTKDIFSTSSKTNNIANDYENNIGYKNIKVKPLIQKERNLLSASYGYVTNTDYYDINNTNIHTLNIHYQYFLWENRFGLGATSFIGLNKKAYGASANALYFLKRKGMYKIGFGMELLFSRIKSSYVKHHENYMEEVPGMTNLFSLGWNIYQSVNLSDKLSIVGEMIPGSILSNTLTDKKNNKTNNLYRNSESLFMMRIGLGYRF